MFSLPVRSEMPVQASKVVAAAVAHRRYSRRSSRCSRRKWWLWMPLVSFNAL